jgi:hypothetical protein
MSGLNKLPPMWAAYVWAVGLAMWIITLLCAKTWYDESKQLRASLQQQNECARKLLQNRRQCWQELDYARDLRDHWKSVYEGCVGARGCNCVEELVACQQESLFHLQSDMESHGKLAACYACAPRCRKNEE